jgi:hypothetical protein
MTATKSTPSERLNAASPSQSWRSRRSVAEAAAFMAACRPPLPTTAGFKRCPVRNALSIEIETGEGKHGRGLWYCLAPADHTLDDVLAPEYFGYFSDDASKKPLRVGDIIEIENEGREWLVRARVEAVRSTPPPGMAKCVYLRELTRSDLTVDAPAGFEFRWEAFETSRKSVKGGWAIYSTADGRRLEGGFASQGEACIRLEEQRRGAEMAGGITKAATA